MVRFNGIFCNIGNQWLACTLPFSSEAFAKNDSGVYLSDKILDDTKTLLVVSRMETAIVPITGVDNDKMQLGIAKIPRHTTHNSMVRLYLGLGEKTYRVTNAFIRR
jgi:hypothetical protein